MRILNIKDEQVHFFLGSLRRNKPSLFSIKFNYSYKDISTYPMIFNLKIFKYSKVYNQETYNKSAEKRDSKNLREKSWN